MASLALAKRFQ